MSFTDRKTFTVTAEDVARFARLKKRFNCSLCGRVFEAGSYARWIYANGTPGLGCGNFFVCIQCDAGDEVCLAAAKKNFEDAIAAAKRWGIYGPDWQQDAQ